MVREMSQESYGLRVKKQEHYTDGMMSVFLKALDEADFEVTDWEAGFIESNLIREVFTSGQRVIIERLIDKYGHRMKW